MADEVEVETQDDATTAADEVVDESATTTAAQGGDETDAGDTNDDADDSGEIKPVIDWKAMSRKWEKRAKENAKRAEENDAAKRKLDETTVTTQTELDQLRSSIQALQTENETNKLKALRADISKETGVPIELLTASTADELNDQAEAIKAFVEANAPKPAPRAAAAAKPKEKLRSGAAGAKPEMSREELLAAVMGKSRRRGAK